MSTLVQETIFVCPACGERLDSLRANKRFHGNACRARYWRMKRDAGAHASVAQAYIAEIASLSTDPDSYQEVCNLLGDINRTLQSALVTTQKAFNWMARNE